ncbi:class V lanthionine synthetase subunit LxmK [Amycolatopsis solani]|uniref:class V lanthionine synthetase subunit LxmK n=1 Tax=Amycolatopsis solani TaxID=3028615 RepID=UPI0025AF989A|nr:class V lanthionine synthetase subunit LxmK [Amycolatopsis sp. MEP2-6]
MTEIDTDDLDVTERTIADSLLTELGLGALDTVTGTFTGRHRNWAGATVSGAGVFVKRIEAASPDGAARLGRLISLESADWNPAPRPRCHGWDLRSGMLVYELIAPARDGARLADDGDFDEATAAVLGHLVAGLHNEDPPPWLDTSIPRLPPRHELDALPLDAFRAACAAELELWRLLQGDDALTSAIHELNVAPDGLHTPTHCDLRLDQFVVGEEGVRLADWDELRLADPARDVGAFAGEWLYRSTQRIVFEDGTPGHRDVVAKGAAQFAAVRPLIAAFWRAYLDHRREPDPDLARRSAAFAGWHQFDRVLAAAHGQSRLLPVERAAAGIGRAVLLAPQRFTTTLGLAT